MQCVEDKQSVKSRKRSEREIEKCEGERGERSNHEGYNWCDSWSYIGRKVQLELHRMTIRQAR